MKNREDEMGMELEAGMMGGPPPIDEMFGGPEPSITIEMNELPTRKPDSFGMGGMPGLPEPLQRLREGMLKMMGGAPM